MNKRLEIEDIRPWFDPSNYADVRSFGHKEWYLSLSFRKRWSIIDDELQHLLKPDERWEWYYRRARPTKDNLDMLEPGEFDAYTSEALVPLVEISPQDGINDVIALVAAGYKLLAVDPNAPEPEVRKKFEDWMLRGRGDEPSVRRTGRPSLNIEITSDKLRSWADMKVIECFDIDFWAKVHGRKDLSHADLSHLLMGKNSQHDPKPWGRRARKHLKEALSNTYLLAHHSMTKTKASGS